MRTLYIFIGQTRAWQLTHENVFRNCLDSLPADLALCVGTHNEDTSNPYYQRASYVWAENEDLSGGDGFYEQWFDMAARELGGPNRWRELGQINQHDSMWLGPLFNMPSSGGILLWLRWYLLKQLKVSGAIDKYDWFVITRSDYQHLLPHVPVEYLDPDRIWLPNGEHYAGITDRHMVVSRKYVERVLSLVHDVWTDVDRLLREMQIRRTWTTERFLLFQLQHYDLEKQLSYFPYAMFTVRKPDEVSRWGWGKMDATLGYVVKYQSEYESYMRFRDCIKTSDDWRPLVDAGALREDNTVPASRWVRHINFPTKRIGIRSPSVKAAKKTTVVRPIYRKTAKPSKPVSIIYPHGRKKLFPR